MSSSALTKIRAAQIHQRIVEGSNGEFFLATTNQYVEKYLVQEQTVSLKTLRHFRQNLIQRRQWAKDHQMRFLHLICPDKQSVQTHDYPIPEIIRLGEYLQQHVQQQFIYPLQQLQQASLKQRVYHQYDSHWNGYGELVALNVLLDALKYPKSTEVLDYWRDQLIEKDNWVGLLSSALDSPRTERTTVLNEQHPLHQQIHISSNHCNAPIGKVLYFQHRQSQSPKRVLVFGDSFVESVVRLLPIVYREILMVRSKSCHYDLMAAYQPDILITSSAEGYTCRISPDELTKPWQQWRQLAAPDHQCDAPLQALFARLDQTMHSNDAKDAFG